MADACDIMVHTQMSETYDIANDDKPSQMKEMIVSGKCDEDFYEHMTTLFSEDNLDQAA